MAKNSGEQNEVFLKTFLLIMYYKEIPVKGPSNIGLIKSLKFSPDGTLPSWSIEYEERLMKRDYKFLKSIFVKAPAGWKADIEINHIKYSVKNSLGAKAAIVNHTSRAGFMKVLNYLGISIAPLDKIIDEYWDKRIKGEIREDVTNESKNSPFTNHKEYLKPILEYFLFIGSGSRQSEFPADKMFIFEEPENMSQYQILTKSQAVDSIWDKLTFSVRSKKGMPTKYEELKHSQLTPWIRFYPNNDSSPKGALHVRV